MEYELRLVGKDLLYPIVVFRDNILAAFNHDGNLLVVHGLPNFLGVGLALFLSEIVFVAIFRERDSRELVGQKVSI